MTNTAATAENIRFNAEAAIDREDRARKVLADAITAGNQVDSYILKPVMEAQAGSLPWRQVLLRMAKVDASTALNSVRDELTELLLGRSESQSTDAITNETERLRRDAAREFLRSTRRMAA